MLFSGMVPCMQMAGNALGHVGVGACGTILSEVVAVNRRGQEGCYKAKE